MRCAARVQNERMIELRSDRSTDARCHRPASVELEGAFGPRWFCWEHARIWREHNRIVERIRSIPVSDILSP